MQSPLISFIITYHNEPPSMLADCIESVLALSLKSDEREIIVIDDGSERCPFDTLKGYSVTAEEPSENVEEPSGNLRYVKQQNQGVSVARNLGLRKAYGTLIQFVDADDQLIKPHYDHCIDLLNRETPDVVSFHFSHEAIKTKAYRDSSFASGADYMASHNMYGSACCYLFRRDIADVVFFKEGKCYSEDEEFTARLLIHAGKTCHTNAPAYLYQPSASSVTHCMDGESIDMRLRQQHDTLQTLHQLLPTLSASQRQGMQRRVAQMTMDYLYNTMRFKHSYKDLTTAINSLQSNGLFPLPKKDYTLKYKLFRHTIEVSVGQRLLSVFIPLLFRKDT